MFLKATSAVNVHKVGDFHQPLDAMFQIGHARAASSSPPADTPRAAPRVGAGLLKVRNATDCVARPQPLIGKHAADAARAADEALAQLHRDSRGRYTGNRRYIEIAILKCGQAGRRDEAQALFNEMQAVGLKPDVRTWNFLLTAFCFGKGASPRRVHAMFQAMRDAHVQPDRGSWNRLVQAYANSGDAAGARRAMQEMQDAGFVPDAICHMQVMSAHAQQGDVGQVLELFREVRDSNVPCDVMFWNQVIKAHAFAANAAGAVATFDSMRAPGSGVRPNVVSCNEVIRAHLAEGDTAAALAMLDDMHAGRVDVPADVSTYTQVIDALAHTGKAKQALVLFRRMRSVGIEADLLACNVAMHACAQASDGETAIQLLREMQAPGSRVHPDAGTWSTAMDACAHAGRTSDVLALLAESQGPDAQVPTDRVIYGTAIKACAMRGDLANAMRVFRDMQDRGIEPDVETYLPLISVQAHGGTPAEAVRLFGCVEALMDATRHIDIVHRVLTAYLGDGARGGAGDPVGAERWLRSIWERDPRTRVGFQLWRALMVGFATAGRPADVQRLLREAIDAGVLQASAGFKGNELDFHLHAVAGRDARGVDVDKCVSAALVPALLAYHRGIGNITDTTPYVVGYRKGDRIKDTVLEALREQGLDYVEDPNNPGRLIPAPRRSVGTGLNASGATRASPSAKEPVDWWDVRD